MLKVNLGLALIGLLTTGPWVERDSVGNNTALAITMAQTLDFLLGIKTSYPCHYHVSIACYPYQGSISANLMSIVLHPLK